MVGLGGENYILFRPGLEIIYKIFIDLKVSLEIAIPFTKIVLMIFTMYWIIKIINQQFVNNNLKNILTLLTIYVFFSTPIQSVMLNDGVQVQYLLLIFVSVLFINFILNSWGQLSFLKGILIGFSPSFIMELGLTVTLFYSLYILISHKHRNHYIKKLFFIILGLILFLLYKNSTVLFFEVPGHYTMMKWDIMYQISNSTEQILRFLVNINFDSLYNFYYFNSKPLMIIDLIKLFCSLVFFSICTKLITINRSLKNILPFFIIFGAAMCIVPDSRDRFNSIFYILFLINIFLINSSKENIYHFSNEKKMELNMIFFLIIPGILVVLARYFHKFIL